MSSNQFISYGIKCLLRVAKLGLIDANMDDVVRKRLKILNHWHKFGLASAVDAFGVSKSTLYAWRKSLAQAGGNTAASSLQASAPSKLGKVCITPAKTLTA